MHMIADVTSERLMSADEELGIVYMPVELPTGDYYGGHRRGSAISM